MSCLLRTHSILYSVNYIAKYRIENCNALRCTAHLLRAVHCNELHIALCGVCVGNKGGERAHDSQREKEKMGVGIGPESYFSLHMILLHV